MGAELQFRARRALIAPMWTQILVILHYAVALAVVVRVLLRPRLEPDTAAPNGA